MLVDARRASAERRYIPVFIRDSEGNPWCPWRDSNSRFITEIERKLLSIPGKSTIFGHCDHVDSGSFAHSCGQSVGGRRPGSSVKIWMVASIFI